MTIPRSIIVLGREYKIRRKRMKLFGWIDDDQQIIWLKSGLKADMAAKTLLHEVIHGILFSAGSKYQLTEGQEESIVRALEHGLYQAGYRLTLSK